MFLVKIRERGIRLSDAEACYREFEKGDYVYMAADMDTLANYVNEPLGKAYMKHRMTKSAGDGSSSSSAIPSDGAAHASDEVHELECNSVSSKEDSGFNDAESGFADDEEAEYEEAG